MVGFKQLPTLQELGADLLLLWMVLQREAVEGGNRHRSRELQDQVLSTGIAKLVTIPIDLLSHDTETIAVLGMLKVTARLEF